MQPGPPARLQPHRANPWKRVLLGWCWHLRSSEYAFLLVRTQTIWCWYHWRGTVKLVLKMPMWSQKLEPTLGVWVKGHGWGSLTGTVTRQKRVSFFCPTPAFLSSLMPLLTEPKKEAAYKGEMWFSESKHHKAEKRMLSCFSHQNLKPSKTVTMSYLSLQGA